MRRVKKTFLFIASLAAIASFGSVWLAVANYGYQRNLVELRTIADSATLRVERSIDLAIIGMYDVVGAAGGQCSVETRETWRSASFSYSGVKDMRLEYGGRTCWLNDANFGGKEIALSSASWSLAKNPNYRLSRVDFASGSALAVRWTLGEEDSVTQIISVHDILFDVLPSAVRDSARLSLSLSEGDGFADFIGASAAALDADGQVRIETRSERFPVTFHMQVSDVALGEWNKVIDGITVSFMAGFATLFGLLVAKAVVREPTLLDDLDLGLKRGEIIPYYQPIFDLESRKVLGFEMLARWIKPDGTTISPLAFIPLAEDRGRIDAVTRSLMKQAGKDVGAMLAARPDLKFTVNITPAQLLGDGFAERFASDAVAFGFPLASLVIEITERQPISDLARAGEVSMHLAGQGIRIAIDDAGTGHNGLSSIHGLNSQFLKIDKYFVDGVALNQKSSVLIEMLVALAQQFDMTVVAEGVETEDQLEALRRLGISQGQGYLCSKPLSNVQLAAFVMNDEAGRKPSGARNAIALVA